MSQENLEIVRQSWMAFVEGGWMPWKGFWSEDIDWRAIEGAPDDVGEIHGKAAMRRYYQDWRDTFEDIKTAPVELMDAGDQSVVAVLHAGGRARMSGVETELQYAVVYTLQDGKVARGREHAEKVEALEAAGLT